MKINKLFISCFTLILFIPGISLATQLANYLGTGKSPRLHLELSKDNGPGWKTFYIDYQSLGTIPFSQSPKNDYSPWNVKDENGNYYGTITLHSDGKIASFDNFSSGTAQYNLEGVELSFNNNIHAYQITASVVHYSDINNPFPDAKLAVPAVRAETGKKIILSTQGDNIIDEQNNTVILKGVVRPSLEWNPKGQNLSVADIEKMHQWGANTIRIDLNQNYWFESAPVTKEGSYKQIINAIIYYAAQNHMAVILDLHWTENGHQSPMANRDSLRFWKEVATDYKDLGTVIFELFNEPVGIDKTVWLNGDKQYAGYQQLYDAVRSAGAKNIVIVNGLDYGYDVSFVNENFKVKGDNIVYGSHPYNEKKNFEQNFSGITGKYPLIFTEFGVNEGKYFPNGYQTVYKHILAYVNSAQVSYTAFAWWVDNANPNIFPDVIKDWDGTPVNGGVYIYDDLLAQPGSKL